MHASVHGTRQFRPLPDRGMPAFPERRRKICRRLAQNLVRLPEFAVLALQRLQLLGDIRGNASPLAAVDLGLLDPVKQRVNRSGIASGITALG